MKNNAKKQTLLLTFVNTAVRFLGMLLRVLLSRMLGAEIIGITELSQSIHMLAIAPLTSGLPLAVSRLTAKEKQPTITAPLQTGLMLVRSAAAVLIPALLLLSPLLARLVGDMRVLPSLWFSAPCILVLGYSAVYNGYCYGTDRSGLPALSEFLEQTLRFAITAVLLVFLGKLSAAWLAAVPVFATLVAEIIGLFFVIFLLRLPKKQEEPSAAVRSKILHLAVPSTVTRLCTTLLHTFENILLPQRLKVSGLSGSEALSRLGMLNGMVMPLVMMPCVFTNALTMVLVPRLVKCENNDRQLKRLLLLSFLACTGAGVFGYSVLYLFAPFFANVIYRLPELTNWIRMAAPLTMVFSFSHVSGGILAALGQQKHTMLGTIPISALTVLLTFFLAARPELRQQGAIAAEGIGQMLLVFWNMFVLRKWYKNHSCTFLDQAL